MEGVPEIMGTFLGVSIVRIIAFWGLDWGPLFLGKYNVEMNEGMSSEWPSCTVLLLNLS